MIPSTVPSGNPYGRFRAVFSYKERRRIQEEITKVMKSKPVAASMENIKREVTESAETQPKPVATPGLEEIRNRAYEMHLERGCIHGWDQDDWFQAELELLEKYQAG
jgi:Protein of unknown function (DUF2934)